MTRHIERSPRAHLACLKWSSQVMMVLVIAATLAPMAESAHAMASSSAGVGGSSSVAMASVGGNNAAAAAAQAQQQRQAAINSLLAQLERLESRSSASLDECASWFQLNQRLEQLTGGQRRVGALNKERECDQLERVVSQSGERLARFKQLLLATAPQLEAVNELVSQFLELGRPESEQLARELVSQREIGAHNTLLQFVEIMRDTLGAPGSPHPAAPATSLVAAVSGPGLHDEAAELDTALRQLVDREDSLTPDELDLLTELYGQLERLLASQRVPVHTGRFRYLSGTLEAARGVMLQGMLDEQEEENQRLQAELLARKQQAEAELIRKTHLIEAKSARNRLVGRSNVNGVAPAVQPAPQVQPVQQQQQVVTSASVNGSGISSTSVSPGLAAGAMASTSASTSIGGGRQNGGGVTSAEASAMAAASHHQSLLPGGRISSAAMASAMAS